MHVRRLLLGIVLAAVTTLLASCEQEQPAPPPVETCDVEPCKLTLPQCGCPDGQMCAYAAGQIGCFNAGTAVLGEVCDDLACAEGLHCLSFIEPPGYCYAYCESDDDCELEGSRCEIVLNREAADSPARACTAPCDLLSGAGCAEGKCFAFHNADGSTFTGCAPAGSKMLDEPCASSSECTAGHICLQPGGAAEMTCLPLCDLSAPVCPMNHTCEGITPAIILGQMAFGACSP